MLILNAAERYDNLKALGILVSVVCSWHMNYISPNISSFFWQNTNVENIFVHHKVSLLKDRKWKSPEWQREKLWKNIPTELCKINSSSQEWIVCLGRTALKILGRNLFDHSVSGVTSKLMGFNSIFVVSDSFSKSENYHVQTQTTHTLGLEGPTQLNLISC